MKTHIYKVRTAYTIEYWYDRSSLGGRSWWARKVDPDGNQIGEAQFAHAKETILRDCEYLDSQIGALD